MLGDFWTIRHDQNVTISSYISVFYHKYQVSQGLDMIWKAFGFDLGNNSLYFVVLSSYPSCSALT
jgi:hypothetical protein